ncbi:MAG: hypothetical protein IT428_32450 [Planctomycetaceae bacterium]|nr:hypothetical protein [Planctomycetaceae bacterium]
MSMLKHLACALLAGPAIFACALAADFPKNTPYYEKDAWYDITEWFDGNDYNPTDEAWWRWDDETYQQSKDTATDIDNDFWYGYSGDRDDDWYYDYYDPYVYDFGPLGTNRNYSYVTRYYDFDKDGFYDSYALISDRNGDGRFEDYQYYSFSNKVTDTQRKGAEESALQDSRDQKVTGKIEKTKMVQVRGGKKHLVVRLEAPDQKDKSLIADLGSSEDWKDQSPSSGDRITVMGPRVQIGKQWILIARSVEQDGKTTKVKRGSRTLRGEVLSTHRTKTMRDGEHLIAIVQANQKDQKPKIAVDLGPADRLKMDLKRGDTLTFSGYPVKINDRRLMMARTVEDGDKVVHVDRSSKSTKK